MSCALLSNAPLTCARYDSKRWDWNRNSRFTEKIAGHMGQRERPQMRTGALASWSIAD